MTQLKKNLLSNYFGQGWRALMSLAFVPLYIKYLGIEAYGLIGIFAMLQAWLSLLDMGMKPALGREMARFTGGLHDAQSIRDLLRSVEIIAIAIAGVVALGIWAASGWLAAHWVKAQNLPVEMVAQAFAVMGVVTALQFVESLYTSTIAGLQRQVMQNVVISLMATVRGLGAVSLLIWISPTIKAFFLWQGLISLVTAGIFAGVVYRILPSPSRAARFSLPALLDIWRFAAGMVGITLLVLLLTQIDKLLLSRLLTLEAFGYYALAGMVVGSLYTLGNPITAALYPRFTELVTREDAGALQRAFHQGAQLVTVLVGSAAVILMVFSDRVLLLWTADAHLAQQVAPLTVVLALGTVLNGLMWIPYHMQLAHGWTTLAIKSNIVAVAVLIPAILWFVPKYGGIGAAWIWVALNAGYVTISIHFMHRRILRAEKWRWYRADVLIPMTAAAGTALLCRWALPDQLGRIGEFVVVLVSSATVLAAAIFSAPLVRMQLIGYLPGRFKTVCERDVLIP
jgi:O-antigen/teichoic acid export membrane protein